MPLPHESDADDMRLPLKAGTTIEGTVGVFTIKNLCSYGGSCLVYLADLSPNEGSALSDFQCLIKEIFPQLVYTNAKQNLVKALCLKRNEEGGYLEEMREGGGGHERLIRHLKNALSELSITQEKAVDDEGVLYKIDAFAVDKSGIVVVPGREGNYDDEDYERINRFYIVDQFKAKAKTLHDHMHEQRLFHKLDTALLIGKLLCEALYIFHNEKTCYLHLDIKPNNILVQTTPGQDNLIKSLRLIDFNSAKKLDPNGWLADFEFVKDSITSNYGFSPPETKPNGNRRLICRASDVYSVVAIMYWAIFNTHYEHIETAFSLTSSQNDDEYSFEVSDLFRKQLNAFFVKFTDRSQERQEQWSEYTVKELQMDIDELSLQYDLELHKVLINSLVAAKDNMHKIHMFERVQNNPPEFSADHTKEMHDERIRNLFPDKVMAKELYEKIPQKWRPLLQLKWASNVWLLFFFIDFVIAMHRQIYENALFASVILVAFLLYNLFCSRRFSEWKASVNYMDCLGYIILKLAYLMVAASLTWSLDRYGIVLDSGFFDIPSSSMPYLYVSAGCGILYITTESLYQWARGASRKWLIDLDYQQVIDSLIDESILSDLRKKISTEYTDVYVIQQLIDIAEKNELARIDDVITAYKSTL